MRTSLVAEIRTSANAEMDGGLMSAVLVLLCKDRLRIDQEEVAPRGEEVVCERLRVRGQDQVERELDRLSFHGLRKPALDSGRRERVVDDVCHPASETSSSGRVVGYAVAHFLHTVLVSLDLHHCNVVHGRSKRTLTRASRISANCAQLPQA